MRGEVLKFSVEFDDFADESVFFTIGGERKLHWAGRSAWRLEIGGGKNTPVFEGAEIGASGWVRLLI